MKNFDFLEEQPLLMKMS